MPFKPWSWVSRLLGKFTGTPKVSWPDRPRFYQQEKPNTCAVACLRMVFSAYGREVSEEELALRAKTDEFGTELGNLAQAARDLGFDCQATLLDYATLQTCRLPIVYLDGPTLGRAFHMHAVVVEETARTVKVLDPSSGERELDVALFREAWDLAGNYAILIQPKRS